MKRHLLLFGLLFAIAGNAVSQEPIAMDGKMWTLKTKIPYSNGGFISDVNIWIDGDTIVEGLACKKLYTHTKQLWDGGKEQLEVGYCRQEGDKYYQNGKLLFDFGLEVSDIFIVYESGDDVFAYTPINVRDTVLNDGKQRKCITIAPIVDNTLHTSHSDTWVEGIGSLSMGVMSNDFYYQAGRSKELLSCSYNGQNIYDKTKASALKPIAMDGKEWNVIKRMTGWDGEEDPNNVNYTWNVRSWIDGDTVVNGMMCKKLYEHVERLWNGETESFKVGYCRQDGDKFYRDGKLMYDFSLQVNDYFGDMMRVKEVGDTVLADGITRKYLLIVEADSWEHPSIYDIDYWVEGIGSLKGGIYRNYPFGDGVRFSLLDCSYNNQYLYKRTETNLEELPCKQSTDATSYYDLMGRKVDSPTRGIYIKDGRKVVIK